MKYRVRFRQYYTYEVEAIDEDEAFDKAHEEFVSEMRTPVAATWYDAVDIFEGCDENV